MENTEAMEQAPKSAELAVANGEASGSGVSSLADQRRRRLVRGAAAFAPMVLTLRSGALAAASCTGARTVSVHVDANGKIPPSVGAQAGDTCYLSADVRQCPDPNQPTKLETVAGYPPQKRNVFANGSDLRCGAENKVWKDTNVAILSSASANSFLS